MLLLLKDVFVLSDGTKYAMRHAHTRRPNGIFYMLAFVMRGRDTTVVCRRGDVRVR